MFPYISVDNDGSTSLIASWLTLATNDVLTDLLRITYFRIPGVPVLHFVPWHRGSGCLGAAAPVTGAAADEYNLNVVDCNASVTVPCLVLKWGSGGYPQPPEANVKDNGFPWPPPGLLGILRKTQFLRYYSVREPN